MIKQDVEADFPNLPFRAYLTNLLLSVGPTFDGINGPTAVPHTELQAWAKNVGLSFEGAEAEWLNKMSAAYADEIHRSDEKDVSAPFEIERSDD